MPTGGSFLAAAIKSSSSFVAVVVLEAQGLLRYASARPIALRQAGSAPATFAAT